MNCLTGSQARQVGTGNEFDARITGNSRQGTALTAKESAMLVLSRKKNESIVINNDITIVVVEIRGDKVRLGVEAPKEVPVHRREVYDAIKRNEAAHQEQPGSEG